jgi:hypothetical protein
MSVPNLVSGNLDGAPKPDATDGLVDFGFEPGFLLNEQAPGLESFGSEDGEGGPIELGSLASWNETEEEGDLEEETDAVIDPLFAVTSAPEALVHPEASLLVEAPSRPQRASLRATISQLFAHGGSWVQRATAFLRNALDPTLRWSRAHIRPRIVFAILVTAVGIGEMGWIGLRAARELKEFLTGDAADVAFLSSGQADGSKAAVPVSPVVVKVQSMPPSVAPRNSRVPGWVAVSAPVNVEIVERGRVLGASWNGGVRLPPGRHAIRIVNRGKAIDVEQMLDIAAGSTTSVLVEYSPGSVQIHAVPSASVRVDGKPVGNTPLMDLQLAGGPHEVLFSHPRFGERRMTINVTSGKLLKLSTDLRR